MPLLHSENTSYGPYGGWSDLIDYHNSESYTNINHSHLCRSTLQWNNLPHECSKGCCAAPTAQWGEPCSDPQWAFLRFAGSQNRCCNSLDMNNRQGTVYYLFMSCTPLHFNSQHIFLRNSVLLKAWTSLGFKLKFVIIQANTEPRNSFRNINLASRCPNVI